jgi:hypothetical protein
MFEQALFDYFRGELADEIAASAAEAPAPLPCDRYVARSALQKAVRRGEVQLAQRAAATLLNERPAALWRALGIISLEDLGVASIDTVARVCVAGRDAAWRRKNGGDDRVAAVLVGRMAETSHCQAACDLLMRVTNDPALEMLRAELQDATAARLADEIENERTDLLRRATATLALAGHLHASHERAEPDAVFQIQAQAARSSQVVATSEAAWRLTGNPMALVLPLLWPAWITASSVRTIDDPIPATCEICGVPSFALDQFTRSGLRVIRALVGRIPALQTLLRSAAVPEHRWPAVVGDLLFLVEGSPVRRRALWSMASVLNRPARPLPGGFLLKEKWREGCELVASHLPLVDQLRRHHYSSP